MATVLPYKGILVGGVLAGVLDILYAFALAAMRGRTPLAAVQSVASGLLGASAYQGGLATGALGLALHLAILTVAAGIFAFAAQRSAGLRRHLFTFGLAFGVLVYLFMNFVVLPLSAVPFQVRYTSAVILQGFVSHAVLVGLPLAWSLRRFGFAPPISSS